MVVVELTFMQNSIQHFRDNLNHQVEYRSGKEIRLVRRVRPTVAAVLELWDLTLTLTCKKNERSDFIGRITNGAVR